MTKHEDKTPAVELSIVLPVFNEAATIEAVLRDIASELHTPHEILVVYDFDEDSTVPVVNSLTDELAAVHLVRNDLGRGVLNAIRAGIESSEGQFVLVTMADGSDDPKDIEKMLVRARAGASVVAASRYMRGGRQLDGPALKAMASRLAGTFLHLIADVHTHDPTNNYKLYARSFLEETTIESERGFELALELTVKAHAEGLRIDEVPTTWTDRTAGESNWSARTLLPGYLRWFAFGMASALPGSLRTRVQARCSQSARTEHQHRPLSSSEPSSSPSPTRHPLNAD